MFVNDTTKISEYRKYITIYGNTEYKNIFNLTYKNIPLKKNLFQSQSKKYVKEFIELEKNNKSDLIEIHNRPIYLKYLSESLDKRIYAIYFHNDPLTMSGSKSVEDRKFLLKTCHKIIFNSNWSKKRFLQGMHDKFVNSEKLLVVFQSAKKNKINLNKKKKWITFVGKLNRSKGYDIFGKAIVKVLSQHKDWKGIVIGDEQRDKIDFKHKNLKKHGFLNHNKVLEIYKKSSIAVVCSRWEEPFGRTSLEASSNACAVIISNRGVRLKQLQMELLLKNSRLTNFLKR